MKNWNGQIRCGKQTTDELWPEKTLNSGEPFGTGHRQTIRDGHSVCYDHWKLILKVETLSSSKIVKNAIRGIKAVCRFCSKFIKASGKLV